MNCPNCLTIYNSAQNLPKILIGCGHTLCDYCIQLLFDSAQHSITCTECFMPSAINDPSYFPKNIALLNMSALGASITQTTSHANPSLQVSVKKKNSNIEQITRVISDPTTHLQNEKREIPSKPVATLCPQHSKKIEAFCMRDKSLLCIDCILANYHRSHKIESIINAFDLERESLFSSYNLALEIEVHLRALMRDIDSHKGALIERATVKRSEVTAIFNEIRKAVHERESTLKQAISQTLIQEETELAEKKKALQNHLNAVLDLRREVEEKVDMESNLQYLGQAASRSQLAMNATAKIEDIVFKNIFGDVRRDEEVAALFRLLNPKSKTSNSNVGKKEESVKRHGLSRALKGSQQGPGTFKALVKREGKMKQNQIIRDYNHTSPRANTTKKNSEKYPSYFHVHSSSQSSKKGVPGSGLNSSYMGALQTKAPMRKVNTELDSSDVERNMAEFSIQSNRAQHSSNHFQFALSPNKVDKRSEALTSRKNSERSLEPDHRPLLKKKSSGYPTRSSVTLCLRQNLGEESPNDSTNNLYKMMQKSKNESASESMSTISLMQEQKCNLTADSHEESFNRAIEELNRNTLRGIQNNPREKVSSVERVRWTKKSTLNEARVRAKEMKNNNLSLQNEEDLREVQMRRTMNESTFKKQRYQSLESSHREEMEDICSARYFTEASKKRGGNSSEEEECQVGSEGKPNNSKISPDTRKRKIEKSELTNSLRCGSFKLNKSLRLSLLGSEAKNQNNEKEEQKIMVKAASIIKSNPSEDFYELSTGLGGSSELKAKLKSIQKERNEGPSQEIRLSQVEKFKKDQMLSPYDSFISQTKSSNTLERAIKSLEISSTLISPIMSPTSHKSREDLHQMIKKANHKNTVLVISGYGSTKIVNERYSIGKDYWTEMTGLEVNRSKFSAVTLPNGNILVIGGKRNEGKNLRLKSIEEYSPSADSWCLKDLQLPESRSGMGTVIDSNGVIYICGGNTNGHITNSCLTIDIMNSNQWVQIPSMLCRRDQFALTVGPDHKIYAIGGFGGAERSPLKQCERFDPQTGKWEAIAPLNQARRALASVCLPDGVYAIGGFDKTKSLATVQRYDIYKNIWTYVGSMKQPRCTHAAIISPDLSGIYAIGGFDEGPLSMVQKYDAMNDEWQIMAPLNRSRFMHQCVLVSFP